MTNDFPKLRVTGGPGSMDIGVWLNDIDLCAEPYFITGLNIDINSANQLATVTLHMEVELDVDANLVAQVQAVRWADIQQLEQQYADRVEAALKDPTETDERT